MSYKVIIIKDRRDKSQERECFKINSLKIMVIILLSSLRRYLFHLSLKKLKEYTVEGITILRALLQIISLNKGKCMILIQTEKQSH